MSQRIAAPQRRSLEVNIQVTRDSKVILKSDKLNDRVSHRAGVIKSRGKRILLPPWIDSSDFQSRLEAEGETWQTTNVL